MITDISQALGLLHDARRMLEAGTTKQICPAIRTAAKGAANTTLLELRAYITIEIAGYLTLSGWMRDKGLANMQKTMLTCETGAQGLAKFENLMTLCRMAWVDRMILSLETEGKLP